MRQALAIGGHLPSWRHLPCPHGNLNVVLRNRLLPADENPKVGDAPTAQKRHQASDDAVARGHPRTYSRPTEDEPRTPSSTSTRIWSSLAQSSIFVSLTRKQSSDDSFGSLPPDEVGVIWGPMTTSAPRFDSFSADAGFAVGLFRSNQRNSTTVDTRCIICRTSLLICVVKPSTRHRAGENGASGVVEVTFASRGHSLAVSLAVLPSQRSEQGGPGAERGEQGDRQKEEASQGSVYLTCVMGRLWAFHWTNSTAHVRHLLMLLSSPGSVACTSPWGTDGGDPCFAELPHAATASSSVCISEPFDCRSSLGCASTRLCAVVPYVTSPIVSGAIKPSSRHVISSTSAPQLHDGRFEMLRRSLRQRDS